jgi:hypothetical protein
MHSASETDFAECSRLLPHASVKQERLLGRTNHVLCIWHERENCIKNALAIKTIYGGDNNVGIALGGMIYIQGFMKIHVELQAILKTCLSNMSGRNVGISDGKDLYNAPLRWSRVP